MTTVPQCGILVVKDPPGGLSSQVPGILATVVGTLNEVHVVSMPAGVTESPTSVATVSSQTMTAVLSDKVGSIDLSALSDEDQGRVRSLLGQYASPYYYYYYY